MIAFHLLNSSPMTTLPNRRKMFKKYHKKTSQRYFPRSRKKVQIVKEKYDHDLLVTGSSTCLWILSTFVLTTVQNIIASKAASELRNLRHTWKAEIKIGMRLIWGSYYVAKLASLERPTCIYAKLSLAKSIGNAKYQCFYSCHIVSWYQSPEELRSMDNYVQYKENYGTGLFWQW